MPPSSPGATSGGRLRRVRRLLKAFGVVLITLVALYYAGRAFLAIYPNVLWFHSVHHSSVYSRQLLTQVVLFVIFAVVTLLVVGGNLAWATRDRRQFNADPGRQRWRYTFTRLSRRTTRVALAVVTLYFAISIGSRAAGGWQTWLLWRHAVSFHTSDPQFHRDASYYVFIYPLHRLVLTLLFRIVLTALVLTVVAGYFSGGLRLRGVGPRLAPRLQAQLSLLAGGYLVLKAFAYWLDRYATMTSQHGVVTGASYTDVHALIPDKFVLLIIAAVFAVVLFANVGLRRARLLLLGVGGMAVAAFVFGVAVPALVQQFKDKPSASTLELPYVARNISATRTAFDVQHDVADVAYGGSVASPSPALREQAKTAAQIRLLDPNRLSPTFTALQQQKSYYGFKSTLDVDHYPIDGKQQDVLVGAREFLKRGLPSSQQTWTNQHLVYTHGYGIVAADTDKTSSNQPPAFVEQNIPPTGALGTYLPQIYYGQVSSTYSIVGSKPGAAPMEFNYPTTNGARPAYTTHVGGGGIEIGSWFRRLVYAVKYTSPSILFSSDVNSNSQLLTVRNPRARVAAVAPWLTLDGDVYPVVSGGRILWVVDGYTTSSGYPASQEQNLRSATSTTLSASGSTVTQPSSQVNYIRNSVKATVDAYSGKVTLYSWNQGADPDPILSSWEKSFPGLVQPQSAIPSSLLPHLRYPQDLFNLQRTVLTKYHVNSAQDFYGGSDFWRVPNDPNASATFSTNSLGNRVSQGVPAQPSVYMTLSPDGGITPERFSLSSPLVSLSQRSLAAFLSVDAQPGPDYGKFSLLEMQSATAVQAPAQIRNVIESDPHVVQQLTLLRGGRSQVVIGNLLAIPIGGQIAYVEPIYTQSVGTRSYPTYQKVVVLYGNGRPAYASSLSRALTLALAGSAKG